MSRTVRLLELLVRLQTLRQFTVQALADEFGVSRRTMHRDLQSLSELGVPLAATSGPHGGYRLIREQQLPPLMLTEDEAIALVVSYESLQQYADSPFDFDKSAAMAKIQGAHVSLRADRVIDIVDRVDNMPIPAQLSLREWMSADDRSAKDALPLRVHVTAEGMRYADWSAFGDYLHRLEDGAGVIDMMIRTSDVDFYARFFIRMGTDAIVQSPPELRAAIRVRLTALFHQYEN